MAVSYATYERIALEDSDAVWELVCGKLREKPPMTQAHNSLASRLVTQLVTQLDQDAYEVRMNAPALRVREGTYLVPDVAVVPQIGLSQSKSLETYEQPLPFVAEVWSPSTGDHDLDAKIPEYLVRGDQEIWRVHTRDKSVTIWRRLPEGEYSESWFDRGVIELAALPGVSVELGWLFR